MLAAFEEAGLAESHAGWIVGNWVGDPADVVGDPAALCADARPAEEHSHFFTDDRRFGSFDAVGEQVDDGDYAVLDAETLELPIALHRLRLRRRHPGRPTPSAETDQVRGAASIGMRRPPA